MRLYRQLGIKLKKSNFTFSFATLYSARRPYLLYDGQNGTRGFSMPGVSADSPLLSRQGFTQRANSLGVVLSIVFSYICLVVLALYHHACGHLLDPHHPLNQEPLHVWAKRHRRVLHPSFVDDILLCLFSAVATSSYDAVERIPAAQVLLYVAATFMRDHYTVDGGVQTVQAALTHHLDKAHIHLSCSVERIERRAGDGDEACIVAKHIQNGEETSLEGFEHVILATPASLSSAFLRSYLTSMQRDAAQACDQEAVERVKAMQDRLAQIRYEQSVVINHTDTHLLPADKRHWRDLNLVSPSPSSQGMGAPRSAMATHVIRMPSKHGRESHTVLQQTTNPSIWPAKETILSMSTFMRAITPASKSVNDGLFDWHLRQCCSLCDRLVQLARLLVHFGQRRPTVDLLDSDWLTSLIGALTGRRWVMVLGHLQQSQPVSDRQQGVQACLWVCGSYAQGIPLLEGCITSSILVVNEILTRTQAAASAE